MKTEEQLINNIIGQLQGIKNMLDQKKDCFQVLTQLKAVKSAMNSLTVKFLNQNFDNCVKFASAEQKNKFEKLIKELSNI